jgi:hypothetical protein
VSSVAKAKEMVLTKQQQQQQQEDTKTDKTVKPLHKKPFNVVCFPCLGWH